MAESSICPDCHRLWREYVDAISVQLETVRQSQAAAVQEDSVALMNAEWLERASVRNRQSARYALSEHQLRHLIRELEERHNDPATEG